MSDYQASTSHPPLSDEGSFEQVVASFQLPLLRFFQLRGCSREDCQDLAQQTFVKLHKSAGSFRGESSFKTWLLGMAINVWREALKARDRQKRRAEEESVDALLERRDLRALAMPAEQLDTVLASERGQLVRAAIGQLPERMRECMLLSAEGRTQREIAILLGVQEGTVKSALFDARARLRRDLGAHFPEL